MACHNEHEHGEHRSEGTKAPECCGEGTSDATGSCCGGPGGAADEPADVHLHT
jgi:hypothetical protein